MPAVAPVVPAEQGSLVPVKLRHKEPNLDLEVFIQLLTWFNFGQADRYLIFLCYESCFCVYVLFFFFCFRDPRLWGVSFLKHHLLASTHLAYALDNVPSNGPAYGFLWAGYPSVLA